MSLIRQSFRHSCPTVRFVVFQLQVAVVLWLFPIVSVAQDAQIVRVVTKSGTTVVGDLLKDDAKSLDVMDFKTNALRTISKEDVSRVDDTLSADDAARYVGLNVYLAHKISMLASKKAPVGRIAKVNNQVVYLTLSQSSGIKEGQNVTVYRGEGDIVDPDTGKVLGTERARIAELVITEVQENISKAKLIGDLEIKLEVGDEVEPQGSQLIVAVCPPSNDDGSESSTGRVLAEELVSTLVQKKVTVVERSALDMVLGELLAQNTILFDEKSAQKIGELTGASKVLTGKITQERSTSRAHLRLIDVQSGEIIVAVSSTVKTQSSGSSGSSRDSSSKSLSGGTGKGEMNESNAQSAAGKMDFLGKSRSLPKYLTTTESLRRMPDGGVRLPQEKAHYDYEAGLITTKDRGLLAKNFVFEALVTFNPGDGIAHIGIGSGMQEQSANRRMDSVFLRFHPPELGQGEVQLHTSGKAESLLGKVSQRGIHMVRFIKEGDALTIQIDPENDGASDDDFETTIPDLKEHARFLNSKNCSVFLSGTATFVGTRFEILR